MERAARNLWILAGISVVLLIYQAWTLAVSVLLPLLSNPNVLQTDFHYYYEAAVRFRGDGAQLYRLSDDVIAGFAYPPPAIVPFMVLSFLPLGAAMALLTASSYALLMVSMVLWVRYLRERGVAIDPSSAAATAIIAVALGPVYSNAIFGQVNAWVLACVVLFVTLGPLHRRPAGAALAAGVLLKIYPILMVAEGLWNGVVWRRIGYAAVAAGIIIVIAQPVVPIASYQTFLNDVLPARFDKTAVHISNQSLIAFIERFGLPADRFLNWTGEQAVTAGGATRAFNWMFGVVVIALLWQRAARRPRVDAVHSVAALIALAAVIAPLGWGHTYVLALPLVMLHLLSVRRAGRVYSAVVFACVLVMLVPAGRRFGFIDVLPAALQNIAYSRYLLATLVLIALPLPLAGAYTNVRRTA
jgi:alpha-1,2-mannosyltransferase